MKYAHDRLPVRQRTLKITDEGYLKGNMAVSKVGVLEYPQADGSIRRLLVPRETLDEAESIESLHLKPITVNVHPEAFLDAKNIKDHACGVTGESVSFDGSHLVASFCVSDADAIRSLQASGIREVSAGYSYVEVEEPGVDPVHGAYDAIQTKRRYNHVSIVPSGRAGPTVRILDAREEGMLLKKIADVLGLPEDGTLSEDVVLGAITELRRQEPKEVRVEVDEAEFIAYHKARKDLEALAETHGLDASSAPSAQLKRQIVAKIGVTVAEDATDDFVSGMLAMHRAKPASKTTSIEHPKINHKITVI